MTNMTPEQIAIATLYIQIALLIIQIPTLIALIVYVIETRKMAFASIKSVEIAKKALLEMTEQRDAEIAPYIVAYLDFERDIFGTLYLVIKNTGKTVAKNVKVIFDPPLQTQYPDSLQRILPPDGIPSIPPNYEIKTSLGSFANYKKTGAMTFNVKVMYYGGINNKPREDMYYLDLTLFRGIVYSVENKPSSDTTKALQNIQSSSVLIVEGLQKISNAILQTSENKKSAKRKSLSKKSLTNK